MYAQAEDVISVLCVKSLLVLLLVVDDSSSCYMIHNLSSLGVKEVVAAVITTVTAIKEINNNHKHFKSETKKKLCLFGVCNSVLCIHM